ncbi:hypothetical protein B5P43_10000 [Bacillus sp. SRB_336]|nr:hypothetical protein B5P43_10000 [Bacillus sp. SRB_336]
MIDFKKLSAAGERKTPSTILETFERLDRQVTHVELRPTQLRILDALTQKIDERDVVLKLNTGGGKTTVGLLYLKHQLDRFAEPVVYLVPTVQLAEQVIQEGQNIGFPVYHWKKGETYPPDEALRCSGAIVCTYEKFFNGRSTFSRQKIVPAAIVLDDVHAGVESVRGSFGCDLPEEAVDQLKALLSPELKSHDPIVWSGIEKGLAAAILEVPFWIQQEHIQLITEIFANYADSAEMRFSWPNIAPVVEAAKIFISGSRGYLIVDPPLVDRVVHYTGAKHRLFMSASVHDGAVLVRELGCGVMAADDPVEVSAENAVGERMVIVPSLINPEFSDEELVQVATAVKSVANVVILVPSFDHARKWKDAGALVASNDNIKEVIAQLKGSAKGNLVVFAQRYDGVDLPDNACRLLIVDGLPLAENLADKNESVVLSGVSGVRGKTANKIEQGLGRSVRSSSDYCAVILAGRDIAQFVSRTQVVRNFSPYTIRQLEIGRNVSEALRGSPNRAQAVIDTIAQCLRRDPDWKAYYAQEMNSVSLTAEAKGAIARRLEIASFEREALRCADARDYASAHSRLQRAADLCDEREVRGSLKQSAAKFQYFFDKPGAMQMQASAYADNNLIARPPMLVPAQLRRVTDQAEAIVGWLRGFNDPNGAIISLSTLKAKLAFAGGYKAVEGGVMELGEMIGAESLRPDRDFKRGPDNLWIFGDEAFVVEVKSDKYAKLSKGDAEQLQSSSLWVSENYKNLQRINRIIISDISESDVVGDFAFGAKVWMQSDIEILVERLRDLTTAAVAQGTLFLSSAQNIQGMLGPHELLPGQIRALGRKPV